VSAQSGTVSARASISLPPVTGAGIQNLDFGDLLVGATGNVPPGPPSGGTSSAGWQFAGIRKGRTVVLTFTLPAVLLNGANALPVNWNNANYGTFCASRNGGACDLSGAFNPASNGAVYSFPIPNNTSGNNYDLLVYAGATTTVPSVPPGVYSATVTLSMAYQF
jgi:hypothetical protein